MKSRLILSGTCLVLLSLIVPLSVFSQDSEAPQTLLSATNLHFSGYGGPAARLTTMKGEFGLFMGGRGGAIINDSLVIGGGGYGLVLPKLNARIDGEDKRLGLGYGGFLVEYYFFPKNLVGFSLGTLVGVGGVGEHRDRGSYTAFFIVEPEAAVFVNVTRFFRLGAGAAYRYSNGINLDGFTDEDFRGLSGSLVLGFGWF